MRDAGTGDFESQRATRDAIRRELGASARRTVTVKDFVFRIGTNTVHHKLGRKPQGWRLQRDRGSLFQAVMETSMDDKTITMSCTGVLTADIEVW